MITREDDVDAHALHRRGWTISAIARHLGHDRKTIRAYLQGGRVAGQRRRVEPDPFGVDGGHLGLGIRGKSGREWTGGFRPGVDDALPTGPRKG